MSIKNDHSRISLNNQSKQNINISKNVIYNNNHNKIIRFYFIDNLLNIKYYPPSLFAISNFYDMILNLY